METNKTDFKPFDRVLVRDTDDQHWRASLYDQYRCYDGIDELYYPHRMVGEVGFKQCIPYEGNEHLLGTTDSPKKPERWKPKNGEMYYCIAWSVSSGFFTVRSNWDAHEPYDTDVWKAGNCFRTEEEAQQVIDQMNEALERILTRRKHPQ